MEFNCCYRTKVDSKAYSDCICLNNPAVRIEIANALEPV